MSGKYALIIGNTEYVDPGLAQLTAPGKDAEDFARVLKDQEIGAFDSVNILLNQSSASVTEAIDEFFDQKKQDDLLVLYFSGHGVRDELGALYLAVKNTIRSRLRSTAVKSDFIREAMDQSRSKRQVLILDCCNSGAFAQGTKAATGGSIGTATAFESGFGRIILTASDSTQFAWEGDKVIGETDNSLFTHYLVEGLKGDADNDGDGRITVDELYDYAYEKVRHATPKQTPSKFSTKQQGEIVLRQSTRIEDIKPVPLPDDLISAAKSSLSYIREAAVKQLDELLKGKNRGLARSAKEALEHIAENDDSRTISRAAFQALEAIRQAEQVALQKTEEERLAKLEVERIAEEERRVREHAEAERKTKAEAERLVAAQKVEEERITKAKLEAERLAEEKRLSDEAEKERQARAEAKRLADEKAEVERLATQRAEEERVVRAKLEAAEKTTRMKVGNKSISREVLDETGANKLKDFLFGDWISLLPWMRQKLTTKTFLLSWKGRCLIGGIFGIIHGLVPGISSIIVLYSIFGYSLVGFIVYPHKSSILFLILGFFFVGFVFLAIIGPQINAFFFGALLGSVAGALFSRILYWLKVVK